jgi:hypothetical protein
MLSKEKTMGDQIRSTWEIVLEKLEKIGKADPEELKLENLKESAYKACAKFLNEPTSSWEDTVGKFLSQVEPKYKRQAIKFITEVLLKNIVLPKLETQLANSERAIAGLSYLFKGIPEMGKLIKQTEALIKEYYAQRKALYEELKKRYSAELSALEQALSNNLGVEVKVSAEQHPQFQEEWRKISEYIDREAEKQLEYLKQIFQKVVS